jgi:hypothetical protein
MFMGSAETFIIRESVEILIESEFLENATVPGMTIASMQQIQRRSFAHQDKTPGKVGPAAPLSEEN